MLTRCTAGGDAESQAVCDHALTAGPLLVGRPLVNSLLEGLLPIHSSLGAVPSVSRPLHLLQPVQVLASSATASWKSSTPSSSGLASPCDSPAMPSGSYIRRGLLASDEST